MSPPSESSNLTDLRVAFRHGDEGDPLEVPDPCQIWTIGTFPPLDMCDPRPLGSDYSLDVAALMTRRRPASLSSGVSVTVISPCKEMDKDKLVFKDIIIPKNSAKVMIWTQMSCGFRYHSGEMTASSSGFDQGEYRWCYVRCSCHRRLWGCILEL
ncbi:hypothetical protein TIFTF001_028292 [Ficus carica]|uniref:Uncharacterized protein n=1 Tax=Ficus carica TaxID=3494 RepID=A0AA88J104_FICCA|nr:hypothetical protein TIFTF001_028292 [Ficus carica]